MAKDAYYFSHDSNARHDPKILQMRSVYKSEGVGWYWMLLEMMREQELYKIPISGKYTYNAYAMELDADAMHLENFVKDCISEFQLFASDGEYLWSESLLRRMITREEVIEKKRQAALIRWGKDEAKPSISNAYASKSDASSMLKRKGKEIEKERKLNNTTGTKPITTVEKPLLPVEKAITTVVIPEWINKEVWDGYLEMRNKKRDKPTNHAIDLIIKELDRFRSLGENPNAVLDNSTMMGYKKLVPPDRRDNNNGTYKKRPGQIPKVYTEIPIVPIPD